MKYKIRFYSYIGYPRYTGFGRFGENERFPVAFGSPGSLRGPSDHPMTSLDPPMYFLFGFRV